MKYVYRLSANFKIIFRKHLEYSDIHMYTHVYTYYMYKMYSYSSHVYILHHVQMNLSVHAYIIHELLILITISQIEHNNARKHHLLNLVAHFCIESLRSLITSMQKQRKLQQVTKVP